MKRTAWGARILCLLWIGLAGCEEKVIQPAPDIQATTPPPRYAPIVLDGSSTVHPISRGVLDLYAARLVTDVELEFSGTGGGFRKFCEKGTDINAASRPITSIEGKRCLDHGVSYVELPIAFDGVAVVVPQSNDWVTTLSITELRKIWNAEAEGTILSWKDIRSTFPDRPLRLYGPGADSGTFDFFTSVINGSAGTSRSDYTSSENDQELATKIAQDPSALGYFGLSHHQANADKLKLVAIDDENPDNGVEAVLPSAETVSEGLYQPLSRPLFLYISKSSLDRKEVVDFVDFYLKSARLVAPDVGAVGLSKEIFALAHERLDKRRTGSAFQGIPSVVGLTLVDLLRAEQEEVTARADSNTNNGIMVKAGARAR